ncbi:MAG: sortase [Oscillospiraceae bacterium]|nr:sortase [Oscillospiraceae bacterium]
MKNKKGNILIALGIIFIAGAIGLCGYNLIESKAAEESSKSAVIKIEQQIIPKKEEDIYENAAEMEIPDYILDPEMDMPKIEIDGTEYIGTLEIPSLRIKLPIIGEWSYPNLKIAPCRYFGSAYLDNMVIAAHNYSSHFREIENLSIGDEVIFTDADGNVFFYSVSAKEVLPPTAIEEMTGGEWDLTLFTCNSAGNFRITVRCDKT